MKIYVGAKRQRRKDRKNRRQFGVVTLSAVVLMGAFISGKISASREETADTTAFGTEQVTMHIQDEQLETAIACGGKIANDEFVRSRVYTEKSKSLNFDKKRENEETEIYEDKKPKYSACYSEFYDLKLSESDYTYLVFTTFAEASYPQDHEKELVSIASSIIKRVAEEFDDQDTFEEVLFAKGQFSTTDNDAKKVYYFDEPNIKEEVTRDVVPEIVLECVNRALEGEDPTSVMVTDGADSFYSAMYISDEELAKLDKYTERIQFADTVFYRQNEKKE